MNDVFKKLQLLKFEGAMYVISMLLIIDNKEKPWRHWSHLFFEGLRNDSVSAEFLRHGGRVEGRSGEGRPAGDPEPRRVIEQARFLPELAVQWPVHSCSIGTWRLQNDSLKSKKESCTNYTIIDTFNQHFMPIIFRRNKLEQCSGIHVFNCSTLVV